MGGTNLLRESVARDINLHIELVCTEDFLQLLAIGIQSGHDRNDHDLTRAEPERPFSAKVLRDYAKEALEATNDGTVNNHGTGPTSWGLVGGLDLLLVVLLFGLLLIHVLKLEVDGSLVIQLNGGALELTLKGVLNGDVNLWAVEGSIALINDPVVTLELGHGLLELILGAIPGLQVTHVLLRASGQLQLEGETEQPIDGFQKVEQACDFRLNLLVCAEDMAIVLIQVLVSNRQHFSQRNFAARNSRIFKESLGLPVGTSSHGSGRSERQMLRSGARYQNLRT